jgi:NAD(P)-dependent dehydrogenase (short-subunit alcohol dehydrogenase family)
VTLNPKVVVTGATGAIGSEVATLLVKRGARVVLMARPSPRLNAMVDRLSVGDNRIATVPVDLSSLQSVRTAARQLFRQDEHIAALVHIAATFTTRYQKGPQGLEMMLTTNHLAPFLMTNMLRDRLTGGGRVITVTAPSTTRVDVDRLLNKERFSAMHTFGATKAANLMFTFELARRAKRWDVRANAFFPGLVRSELMHEATGPMQSLARLFSREPDHAGPDLVDLALSPAFAGTTGWFFKGGRRIDPPKQTQDIGQQSTLWKRSAELVELEIGGF